MNKTIFTILMSPALLLSSDIYLNDYIDQVEITEVIDNKLSRLPNTTGKTYNLKNNLSIVTSTNGESTCLLPHKIAIYQRNNTSLYFNGDDIKYNNNFVLPEVLSVKESLFNLTFSGEIYVVSQSTNQNTIGTSLSNIIFDKARLFVKSDVKYTHVYVIDGSAIVVDNKSNKKRKELKSGDYLVITPQVILNPRENSVKSSGNSFSVKDTDIDESASHKSNADVLENKLNNVIFVNYTTNIFGVKIK